MARLAACPVRPDTAPVPRSRPALLICQAAAVRAQPATAQSFRDLIASAPLLSDGPATAEPDGPDGSRFTGPRFGFRQRFGYRIGTLVEHGIPFGALDIPQRRVDVRVEASGIVLELHSGQAKTDWLNRQSQTPFDVGVAGSYDPVGQELILRELRLEGSAIGRTTLAPSRQWRWTAPTPPPPVCNRWR